MLFAAIILLAVAQDDLQTHFDQALSLSQQHQDDAAIAEFRKVLELKPGLYEADLNLGILLLRNQKAAGAALVLKQAVEAKPQELRPNLFYAQALLDSGDSAQAEYFFSAALQIEPKSALAQAGIARALLKQNKLPEAAQQFRALANKDGLLEVAAAQEKAGDTAAAMAIYRELGDTAHLKNIYLAEADKATAAKQPAKAIEQLQLALQLDPKDFELHMAFGRALRDQHNLIAAANQFYAAAQIQPTSVPAWNELASALIVAEKYAEGLAALDKVRALGREIPGDLYLRAITLDKLKQKPLAIAAYREFLAADSGAHPDQEFLSRQRIRIIESELKK